MHLDGETVGLRVRFAWPSILFFSLRLKSVSKFASGKRFQYNGEVDRAVNDTKEGVLLEK